MPPARFSSERPAGQLLLEKEEQEAGVSGSPGPAPVSTTPSLLACKGNVSRLLWPFVLLGTRRVMATFGAKALPPSNGALFLLEFRPRCGHGALVPFPSHLERLPANTSWVADHPPDPDGDLTSGWQRCPSAHGALLSHASSAPPDDPEAVVLRTPCPSRPLLGGRFEKQNLHQKGLSALQVCLDREMQWIFFQRPSEEMEMAAAQGAQKTPVFGCSRSLASHEAPSLRSAAVVGG